MERLRTLLADRGARLLAETGDPAVAQNRARLSRRLAAEYPAFDPIRRALANPSPGWTPRAAPTAALVETLRAGGYLTRDEIRSTGLEATRYLSGGWLEEYAWHAIRHAGADAAVHGQKIAWRAGPYDGFNEIDVIARKGDRLLFLSCKAYRADLEGADGPTRRHLMSALNEADNLDDHFGRPGDRVILVTTTDLIDEVARRVRFESLFGKALALDVRVIGLDDLPWERFVPRLTAILAHAP